MPTATNPFDGGLSPEDERAILDHLDRTAPPGPAAPTADCEILCVVDRSGSMQSIRTDAVGGFNAFLDAQRRLPGTARLSLTLFDHELLRPLDAVPLPDVAPLDDETYVPRGSTALYDAIGTTLTSVATRRAHTAAEARPPKVIVAILTDGMENASTHYSRDAVAGMIAEKRAEGWEFVFLAANQDAFAAAERLSIPRADAMAFAASPAGTRAAFAMMEERVAFKRSAPPRPRDPR